MRRGCCRRRDPARRADNGQGEKLMQELAGKTAFVTGGAGGIGLALGRAFAEAGMNVMLADIEAEALTGAVRALHGTGPGVHGVICDVADAASVDDAANAAY